MDINISVNLDELSEESFWSNSIAAIVKESMAEEIKKIIKKDSRYKMIMMKKVTETLDALERGD